MTQSLHDMAQALRAAGWTVCAPVKGKPPPLVVGQTWAPAVEGRQKPRTITFIGEVPGRSGITDGDAIGYILVGSQDRVFDEGGVTWHTWASAARFRAWIRKHNARPVMP